MAEKLQFKRGLLEKLNDVTKVAGTLYVTTDEQAIYYDVSDTKRIRLSQSVIQVDSVHGSNPPYSDEALYYFIKENALMKWDSASGRWSQLNSTQAINDLIGTSTDDASKETVFGKIKKAQDTADTANAAANAAQERADAAYALAETKTTMTEVEGKGYITAAQAQTIADGKDAAIKAAKDAADAAQDAADTANAAAGAAQTAADKAQATADLKAPINHASEKATYGLGNATNYGHVKLSDATDSDSGVSGGVAATPAAVKAAKAAADDAQAAAEAAQAAANTNAGSITTINGQITTINNTLITHADDIKALKDTVGESGSIGSDVADLKTRMASVETKNSEQDTKINKNTADLGTLTATVNENETDAENKITAINTAIGKTTDVTTANTVYGYINKQKAASDSALNTAKTELQNSIDTKASQTELDTLTAAVNQKADKTELEAAKTELNTIITDQINAANAMTYKGTVDGDIKTLPTSGVSVGDTYVATKDMVVDGVQVYVGDLLIAKGGEEDNIITSNLGWDVAATGYHSVKDPKLTVGSNVVELRNAANALLGSATFAADAGTNLKVSTSGSTITYSMEWGTF